MAPKRTPSTAIEVFVGTYDNYLFAYHIVADPAASGNVSFARVIGQPLHTASIRCLATSGALLASGAADDRICVIDIRRRRECQLLTHHTGTVNAVAFTPDGSHLFSVADDGRMAATRCGNWQTDNVWRTPHSGKAVGALAVHPSGKLALSVGRDGTLRTWNLVKGRQVYTTALRTLCKDDERKGETVEKVLWSPDGGRFALLMADRVMVMAVAGMHVVAEWRAVGKRRATVVCWLDEERLLVGLESGKVRWLRVGVEQEAGTEPIEVQAHGNRVKDMAYMHGHLVTMSCTSSTGAITLWRVNVADTSLVELCTAQLGRRPICLCLADATLYRPAAEDEQTSANATVVAAAVDHSDDDGADKTKQPSTPARRLVSVGRVTIENDEDEDAAQTESTVSALLRRQQKQQADKMTRRCKREVIVEEQRNEDEVVVLRSAKKAKMDKKRKSAEFAAPTTDDSAAKSRRKSSKW